MKFMRCADKCKGMPKGTDDHCEGETLPCEEDDASGATPPTQPPAPSSGDGKGPPKQGANVLPGKPPASGSPQVAGPVGDPRSVACNNLPSISQRCSEIRNNTSGPNQGYYDTCQKNVNSPTLAKCAGDSQAWLICSQRCDDTDSRTTAEKMVNRYYNDRCLEEGKSFRCP